MRKEHEEKREERHEKHERREHRERTEMQDNRMVRDTHQEGIKRVLQRGSEKREGHFGKMGMGHKSSDGFKVPDNDKTPRRA